MYELCVYVIAYKDNFDESENENECLKEKNRRNEKKFEKKRLTKNPCDSDVELESMSKVARRPRVMCGLNGTYGHCAVNLVVAVVVRPVEVLAAAIVRRVVAVGYGPRAAAAVLGVSEHHLALARDATAFRGLQCDSVRGS
jgi:hypothetical protein